MIGLRYLDVCSGISAPRSPSGRKRSSPEQRAANNLWTRYRLRPGDVERMLEDQGGRCAICQTIPRKPVIDHDHETGIVRGILCHPCNIALPFAENAPWLSLALEYLGRKP